MFLEENLGSRLARHGVLYTVIFLAALTSSVFAANAPVLTASGSDTLPPYDFKYENGLYASIAGFLSIIANLQCDEWLQTLHVCGQATETSDRGTVSVVSESGDDAVCLYQRRRSRNRTAAARALCLRRGRGEKRVSARGLNSSQ